MNFRPTRRKIVVGLVAVVLTYAVVLVWGLSMLVHSDAYAVAQREVGRRLQIPEQVANRSVKVQWWKSWTYRESTANGIASFTLCGQAPGRAKVCFDVVMTKIEGRWNIDSIKQKS